MTHGDYCPRTRPPSVSLFSALYALFLPFFWQLSANSFLRHSRIHFSAPFTDDRTDRGVFNLKRAALLVCVQRFFSRVIDRCQLIPIQFIEAVLSENLRFGQATQRLAVVQALVGLVFQMLKILGITVAPPFPHPNHLRLCRYPPPHFNLQILPPLHILRHSLPITLKRCV